MSRFTKEELKDSMLVYAVTDRHWLKDGETLRDKTEEALKGGATFVQLREKDGDRETILSLGRELKELCEEYKVPFVLDDDVALTEELDADGVHVGQSDRPASEVRRLIGPDKILGVSAQTVEQALQAENDGADYLGVGAVFATGSKDDADDVSHDTLEAICRAVKIPVVAIGGISKNNILKLKGRGLAGVAVISAIYAQEDITAATAELRELSAEMVR
ncbi:MAG: thiamine phosphate synthase [Eubacterium sp.]|nr:thiamine phosphate synthase [Eubacterium sp.]